jgi:hypothetical protein
MYILLATVERKVLVEFPRVPSGAQHRRRFLIMHSAQERNITQLLLKVPTAKSSSSRIFQ